MKDKEAIELELHRLEHDVGGCYIVRMGVGFRHAFYG